MSENDIAPRDWGPHNLKTAADVRRMLRGESPPAPAAPNETPAQTGPAEVSGLGLSNEQVDALAAAGFSDRNSLATALEANGDKGFAGLSRTEVRRLRRRLEGGA